MTGRDRAARAASLALAAGLAVWGCGPPEITPVAPPGVDVSRPALTEADAAEALGESVNTPGVGYKPNVVEESEADSPPTEPGKPRTKPSGLTYETLRPGKGEGAKRGQTVSVHYKGSLQKTGEVFEDSRAEDKPFNFPLGSGLAVAGFDEGATGMKVGEIRRLIIPSNLGYGKAGREGIPPNSTLVFEVELLKIQ